MNSLYDICERKHGGADTSVAANARVAPHKSRTRTEILEAIAAAPDGLTLDDLAELLETQKHKISGRVTELLKLEQIYVAGRRKNAAGNSVRAYKVVA